MKKLWMPLLGMVLTMFLWSGAKVQAEMVAVEGVGYAVMEGNETRSEVEQRAFIEAKRMALEQAGTIIDSMTEVRSGEVTRDEILLESAGKMQLTTEPVYRWAPDEGGSFGCTATVRAQVDTDEMAAAIKRIKERKGLAG